MSRSIRRADDVFASSMDDTLLMMSISRGQYYGLNGVGPRIWQLLEQPVTEDDIVQHLLQEYAVDEATCRREVTGFLAGLRERGLLQDVN